jgi:hypothetical protein
MVNRGSFSSLDRRYNDAIGTQDMQRRSQLLNTLLKDPELPKELEKSVQMGLSIFNPAFPMFTRIDYLVGDESRRSLAADWSLDSDEAGVALFFQKELDLGSFGSERFFRVARLLTSTGNDNSQGLHPLLKAALVYIRNTDSLEEWPVTKSGSEQPATWKEPFLLAAVSARFAVQGWGPADAAHLGLDRVPEAARANFVKWTQKILASSKCAWFDTLKADFEKAQSALAAAEAAAAAAQAEALGDAGMAEQTAGAEVAAAKTPEAPESHPTPAATGAKKQDMPPAPRPKPLLIGEVVLLHATKNKELYDQKKCELVRTLSSTIKLKLLEGPEKGKVITRSPLAISRFEDPPAEVGAPSGSAAAVASEVSPQQEAAEDANATPRAADSGDQWKDVEDVFGDVADVV